MLQKTFICLVIFLCSLFDLSYAQTNLPDTINHKRVVELQTIQLPTKTYVSVLMVDPPGGAGLGYYDRCMYIYRSTDNGANWDSVYYYGGGVGFHGTADPIITSDNQGNVYVVAMRVYPLDESFKAHLWTFRSTNDGISWSIHSNPYTDNEFADYPSITTLDNNMLFLSYSIYTNDSSYITFKRSTDGGLNWSNVATFNTFSVNAQYFAGMGSNLSWTMNNRLCLSFGDNTIPFISFTSSLDSGKTWLPLQSIAMPTTATFITTKIISSKNFNHMGMIACHPHGESYVYYLNSLNGGNTWSNVVLTSKGAYGDGVMDNSGNMHLIYNEVKPGGKGQLTYRYSVDNGQTFSAPLPLINWASTVFSKGEYQSVILGDDGLLHVTYVDWNDGNKCKHLVFAPMLNSILDIDNKSAVPKIYPIPAQDYINVVCDKRDEGLTYSLIDLTGKNLRSGNLGPGINQINISKLSNGTFILMLKQNNITYIQKIIKE